MVQFLWRNDSTLYQPIHTQAGFHVLALVSHMDGGVSDGKLEILAYVSVETHDIHISDSLIITHFIVENYSLRPTTVQSITGTRRSLSHYRMHEEVGYLLKFTFPFVPPVYHRSCGDIPERLAFMPVPKTANKFVNCISLEAVTVNAVVR